jgi:hypothetical protein
MLRGLCEDEVIEALGMLLSREYLRKALNLSEKFTKQKRNEPTGRDGTQTA